MYENKEMLISMRHSQNLKFPLIIAYIDLKPIYNGRALLIEVIVHQMSFKYYISLSKVIKMNQFLNFFPISLLFV
jgi:hypothetical protein